MQDDGEECGIYNDEWGQSANMDVKRVNKLELQFLDAMDWRVNVSLEEYNRVLKSVEEKLAVDQGNIRGWFTYTELERLSATLFAWNSIWPTVYSYAVQVSSSIISIGMLYILIADMYEIWKLNTYVLTGRDRRHNYVHCSCCHHVNLIDSHPTTYRPLQGIHDHTNLPPKNRNPKSRPRGSHQRHKPHSQC